MSSFVRFILKFKHEDNAYGDVARDTLADPMINRKWGYKSFAQHLVYRGASQRVWDTVDDMARQYGYVKELELESGQAKWKSSKFE